MTKNFLISWVVAFVVWMIGSFAVHGAWLSEIYATIPNIMRSEEDTAALMHFMLLAHIVMAGAFVWIYQRGIEDKPWIPQGFRFGLAVALLAPVPMFTIYYVVQQTPGELAIRQAIGDTVVVIFVGLATAFMSRDSAAN